ncbi:hypothetical protein M569_10419, partial [Genlisea aurea]
TRNLRATLEDLRHTLNLAEALRKEMEMLIMMKGRDSSMAKDDALDIFSRFLNENKIQVENQESIAIDAANSTLSKLRVQLEPFRIITDEKTPWEEKCALKSSVDKMEKHKRNKLWRKRKRKAIAENLAREHENFNEKDKAANEWRSRETAKDIAQLKVDKMKEIAKLKTKQGKKSLQSELELVLMIEKVQELRKLRVEKLKKQGRFFPDEDDRFVDGVREAVEEEERREMKSIQSGGEEDEKVEKMKKNPSSSSCDYVHQLLHPEFYHYYHGSSTDLGTLIEVRRQWDAFLRAGG